MSAKISASRRAAFLKALGETGNQTLSAERAKVSRSWVTAQRARDAGFDGAVRAAIEAARERLRPAPLPFRGVSGWDSPRLSLDPAGQGRPETGDSAPG